MFRDLHLKILAFIFAIGLWFFVVSSENHFVELGVPVPVQIFNETPELALASELPTVRLGLRVDDPLKAGRLTAVDFEAYVDLRDISVGVHTVPVSVTSKNPQVTVARIEPEEVTVTLEQVRQKLVRLTPQISGQPANGFQVREVTVTPETITVSGADSLLKRLSRAEVLVRLQGFETESVRIEKLSVVFYDVAGIPLQGITVPPQQEISGAVTLFQTQITKEVSVEPKVVGSAGDGFAVKKVTVIPARVKISGPVETIETLSAISTEDIDLGGATVPFEKQAALAMPALVKLVDVSGKTVKVKVEIGQP